MSDVGEEFEPSSVSENTSPQKNSLAPEPHASTPMAEAMGEFAGPPTDAVSSSESANTSPHKNSLAPESHAVDPDGRGHG